MKVEKDTGKDASLTFMKTYPKSPVKREEIRDFSHLSLLQRLMRLLSVLLVGGILVFIFLKILFF